MKFINQGCWCLIYRVSVLLIGFKSVLLTGLASGGGQPCPMARLGSLGSDGSFPRDGVSIKILVVVATHHHKPLMSENVIE